MSNQATPVRVRARTSGAVRVSTKLLGLTLLMQVASCVTMPYVVLKPSGLVFGACEGRLKPAFGAPTRWCEAAGQGDYDPTLALMLVAAAVLVVSVIAWCWPTFVLAARLHDWAGGPVTEPDADTPDAPSRDA